MESIFGARTVKEGFLSATPCSGSRCRHHAQNADMSRSFAVITDVNIEYSSGE
jgi:hypothetical protein